MIVHSHHQCGGDTCLPSETTELCCKATSSSVLNKDCLSSSRGGSSTSLRTGGGGCAQGEFGRAVLEGVADPVAGPEEEPVAASAKGPEPVVKAWAAPGMEEHESEENESSRDNLVFRS